MTPHELDAAVAAILAELPETAAVYLYGSQARGDAGRDSDVDLAVFTNGEPLSALRMWDARGRVESAFRSDVDLVHLDAVPTVLQNQVIADGVRVYSGDPYAADLFEIRVIREYEDFKRRRAPLEADIAARGTIYGP
jgi:predicted nucleotidyltransferase